MVGAGGLMDRKERGKMVPPPGDLEDSARAALPGVREENG